ncbi:T9SS type A sorting domain-containing protein [Gaetbulibacter sp. M235]|uniref:T9SS type A sorting domain-containing protein n=1 Tax=Gaetbulibacter sp. M235 TaxID=3126510 RepID=UPI00374E5519
MKQIYLLIIFSIFSFSKMNAEACPEAGTTSAGGTQIYFSYPPSTSFCSDRPMNIVVNTSTTFTRVFCSETVSRYDLTSGPAIVGQDFTVTSGFDSSCSYSGGTLPVDEFAFLNESLKVYPNPLTAGANFKLSFGLPIKADINIYSVTGKQVYHSVVANQDKTEIASANLANGIYMLKISNESGSTTRKIVVLK